VDNPLTLEETLNRFTKNPSHRDHNKKKTETTEIKEPIDETIFQVE